ncbi:nuclear transport factor 2-like protein [Pedobacter yonginense]|uniref:nuclear transport factor 2 family protein n=1 Tax=Pedobacter yonginense TaxID=651869 RepID=UPI00197DE0E0|nr:nuclear transport factor 2 family protein [Pedobacter yonginense]
MDSKNNVEFPQFRRHPFHYSDDIEITTPMLKLAADIDTGSIEGKENVRTYWTEALDRIPDFNFDLYEVTTGVNSVAVFYKSVMGGKAIEVMFFDNEGKVNKMFAFYTS